MYNSMPDKEKAYNYYLTMTFLYFTIYTVAKDLATESNSNNIIAIIIAGAGIIVIDQLIKNRLSKCVYSSPAYEGRTSTILQLKLIL